MDSDTVYINTSDLLPAITLDVYLGPANDSLRVSGELGHRQYAVRVADLDAESAGVPFRDAVIGLDFFRGFGGFRCFRFHNPAARRIHAGTAAGFGPGSRRGTGFGSRYR